MGPGKAAPRLARAALVTAAVIACAAPATAQLGGSEAPVQRAAPPPPPPAAPVQPPQPSQPARLPPPPMLPPSSTDAPPPNQGYFAVTFCNKSSWLQFVALNYMESNLWLMEGWWRVERGECKLLKHTNNRYLYYFAESEDRKHNWGNKGIMRCVHRPDRFKYFQYEGECRGTQEPANFGQIYFDKDPGGTFTMTLND